MPALTLDVPGISGPLKIMNLRLHSTTALTGLALDPVTLELGGSAPAQLEGSLHYNNFAVHLHGSAMEPQLLALAHAVPQFGDGIEHVLPATAQSALPIFIDATAQRTWAGMGMYAGPSPLSQSNELWTRRAAKR